MQISTRVGVVQAIAHLLRCRADTRHIGARAQEARRCDSRPTAWRKCHLWQEFHPPGDCGALRLAAHRPDFYAAMRGLGPRIQRSHTVAASAVANFGCKAALES